MNNNETLKILQQARQSAKKRNFSQSVDLIINLRGIDLKKENEKISTFIALPHSRGKKIRITALVGQELATKAKAVCDNTILLEKFQSLEKKAIKKLASESDFFIAQANIMPKVASTFGKILGPRGLMPNPKSGCIVPPTDDLKHVVEKLQKTVKIETKNEKAIKVCVGTEAMSDADITENILAVYNNVVHMLPQEKTNIKNVIVKLTMGKPAVLGEKQQEVQNEIPKKRVKEVKKKGKAAEGGKK